VADLYNVPRQKIKSSLRTFTGLEGRLQFIVELKGVKYINDTTATAPDAALAAIKTISQSLAEQKKGKIILIAGGADKNLDFKELGNVISEKCGAVILLEGTATAKLKKEISHALPISKANSMEKAVALASKIAKTGDIVLLSPGCASFGLFKHEFDRGKKFNEAVKSLK
jgi:UDP-N-acetylmuramoylalanine--D-glutamate ligase